MKDYYSLFRENGRAKPTVPEDIINGAGFEEDDEIEWKVRGKKLLLVEGDQYEIHHSGGRYYAYCGAADSHDAFKDADRVKWGWDKKGQPYMKPVT